MPAKTETPTMVEIPGNSICNLVIVRNQDGFIVLFKIKPQVRLRKLIHVYCNRLGLSKHSVRFRFHGRRIRKLDTMTTMGMKNGDRIDVYQKQLINSTVVDR